MPEVIVITGGCGFLGSHLAERLLTGGCQVICVDNFSTSTAGNVAHLTGDPRFHLVDTDVTESLHIPGRVTAVLHFASPASPPDYLRLPVQTLQAGSAGTLHALQLARQKNARFLLASTSEVYGDPLAHPQTEDYWGNVNPIGPRSVYDEAKRYAEALTIACRHAWDTDTAIVRIFNTYGPRMRPGDGRAVPTFIRQALAGEPIPVTGDGTQTRSLCYVSDLIDGIVRMLRSPHGGPVNLGSSAEITILELAEVTRELAGSTSPITFTSRPDGDPQRRRPSTVLAQQLLGWEPRIGLRDGLTRTIGWFRDR